MEAEKLKEKAKRGEQNHYLELSTPMILTFLSIAFGILTIFTSYQSLAVFPHPRFFYLGSIAFGMMLTGLAFLIGLSSLVQKTHFVFLLFAMVFCGFFTLPLVAFAGTWLFVVFYIVLLWIPPILFPLLFLLAVILIALANYSQTLNHSRPVRIIAIFLIAAIGLYLWGHAINFEGNSYDEGITIEGKSYHSIVDYGWLGDPGTVTLYQCQVAYFFCTMLYQSPYDNYYEEETILIFDESRQLLRLEYHAHHEINIPLILYEHPIP